MSKTTKSSSGDLTNTNPYIRIHAGHEVTTWKIRRVNGKPIEPLIYQKRV
jgi:hypothetical protein